MNQANSGIEARLHLVRANRSGIYAMLCRAAKGGDSVGGAVVIVADTTDPVGHELAEAASEKAGLDLHEASSQSQQDGQIPTAIIVVTLDEAKALFNASHPNVASELDKLPPQGCVRVVSIAASAAMLLHSDVRPTTRIAEA